jgi:hypothetical protein
MQMASEGGTMSSVNNTALRHISNSMRGYLFQITTFIRLTAFWEEKAFPTTMQTSAICAICALEKCEAHS